MTLYPLFPRRQWIKAPHLHTANIVVLLPGISLMSLVYPFPIQKPLKALSLSPANFCTKIIFPIWDRCTHLLPAGSVLCKLTHDQKSRILLVTPGLEHGIDLLFLPSSFPAPERIEDNISGASDPLLSHLKDLKSLYCPWTFCCSFITAYLKHQ